MKLFLQALPQQLSQIGKKMKTSVCFYRNHLAGGHSSVRRSMTIVLSAAFVLLNLLFNQTAQAVPSFARQTGQSCVACHAGGQFPELTPYGRLFKLTGYTIGERGNPLAAMIVGSKTTTQNNGDGAGGVRSTVDSQPIIDFGSIFLAGKATENVGGFAQFTYNFYDKQNASGTWNSHFGSDNFDLRYADRRLDDKNDLIFGLSLHNNPTVQDVWNSTPAWGYPYVSTTKGFGGLPANALSEGALAAHVAGTGGYVYWNRTIFAELSTYQTAKGPWSFLSYGNQPGNPDHPLTHLDGNALLWRLAYTKNWDANSVMLGAFGMDSKVFPLDTASYPITNAGSTRYQDLGFDAQYQYLLAPHAVTATYRAVQEKIDDPTATRYAAPATLNTNKFKVSYSYRATYGASLAYSNVTGSSDATAYSSSALNVPNTEMWVPELFWMPIQNMRVGVQINHFTKYLGTDTNYDGAGRNASDNDTTYVYLWAAF